jgi:hypothetical protein
MTCGVLGPEQCPDSDTLYMFRSHMLKSSDCAALCSDLEACYLLVEAVSY